MISSVFLAKAWGLYLTIISFAFLVKRKNLESMFKAFKDEWNALLSGALSLGVGILMVLKHNIWTLDWRLIITLFGWIALYKGVVRLVWPGEVKALIKKLKGSKWIPFLLVIALALGLYLTYIGFTAT